MTLVSMKEMTTVASTIYIPREVGSVILGEGTAAPCPYLCGWRWEENNVLVNKLNLVRSL